MRNSRSWRFRLPALVLVALILTVGAVDSWAQITGSVHDLSGLDSLRRLCIFCHTPHNADISVTDAPLWNHAVTSQNYSLYSSPTLDAALSQPGGASRLCLSCHDGTIAIDAYGGQSGTIFMAGPDAVGSDGLNNDHPISFQFTDALAAQDGELHPPSATPSLLGGTIEQDLLFNGSLECASCHDVHRGPAAGVVDDSLLMIPQIGSTICLVCHDK